MSVFLQIRGETKSVLSSVREHDGYDALNEAVLAKDSGLMGILTHVQGV